MLPLVRAQNPPAPGQLAGPYLPLNAAEKLKFRISAMASPAVLTGTAMAASLELVAHSPREWGQGVEGYSRRYLSTFGDIAINQTLRFGFETALKEDPRYFPNDGASGKRRIWNALKQTFLTRTDSGATTFAYGRVAGGLATGQITRLWLPSSSNSGIDGLRTSGIGFGVDAAVNILYEFFPGTRPK